MVAHFSIIKDIGRIFFWYPLRWIALLLPFTVIYRLGSILGRIDMCLSGSSRIEKISSNLGRALNCTKSQAKKIALQNFQNHGRNNLEFLKYPQINSSNLSKLVEFADIEHLDKELEKGKGVIVLTAHFGAKQVIQVGLGHKGYRAGQINFHMSREELSWVQKNISQRHRIKVEERIPVEFFPAKGFLRSAYRCLKKGEILIVAADGVGLAKYITKGYRTFQFLGQKMFFPQNIVALAKSTGSSIVPAFAVRKGTKHCIIIEPPISIGELKDNEVFQQFVYLLEKYVRRYPQLWEFWEEFEEGNLIAASDSSSPI